MKKKCWGRAVCGEIVWGEDVWGRSDLLVEFPSPLQKDEGRG